MDFCAKKRERPVFRLHYQEEDAASLPVRLAFLRPTEDPRRGGIYSAGFA
jgi:hypothetical protein